ncbi:MULTISPECIES: alpha/beta hydrolase [unclassified Nocardia]|uniref:alpha/beta hydrolase n=1 Tax=unclassified Nocardia TaxID=2637762 RepID=UPI0035D57D83
MTDDNDQPRNGHRAIDYSGDTHLALNHLSSAPDFFSAPIATQRRYADRRWAEIASPPPHVPSVVTVTMPTAAGLLALRIYRPALVSRPRPGILYFHGGGFVLGGLDSHDPFLRTLCASLGSVVVSVDYRLAPEHPFPAAAEDACGAADYLIRHADVFGIDPELITVAGDGAGAALAATVVQHRRAANESGIIHQILITPLLRWPTEPDTMSRRIFSEGYDLTLELLDWFASCYLPDPADRLDIRAAPGLAKDLRDLPPTTVITAGLDPLRDEGEQYAEELAAANVDVALRRLDGAFHMLWLASAISPAVQRTVIDTIDLRLGRRL